MKQVGRFWVPDAETQQNAELARGGWQIDRLHLALKYVPERRIAVDGGAHVGSWTLAMMSAGFRTVQAFEPSPETFECLQANVHEWTLEHVAKPGEHFIGLHKCALGKENNRMGMREDTKYAGGNTGGRHLKGDGDIPVRPLDIYRWDEIDFIKLDVEGFEPFAIEGATQTILRCKPVILFEDKRRMAHRYGYAPGRAGHMLEALGMKQIDAIGDDRIFGWP